MELTHLNIRTELENKTNKGKKNLKWNKILKNKNKILKWCSI